MAGKENRKYKNSVFVDLYYEDESAEANDIELYNALHDEPLPPGTKIKKIRVEDVLYMNFQNDVSFGAGDKVLVFGEHQSSVNENMPLRSLLYIGRAYEQMIPVRDRYKRKRVMLPKPEFYTFYNGEEKWEKEKILKLSDSYLLKDGHPELELCVKVININTEEHHDILGKCRVLREYSEFVDIIRKYKKSEGEECYKKAVEECIAKGILTDYLRKKGSEVINMLTAEYDYNLDIEVQREEAREEGKAEGRVEGRVEGIEIKLITQIVKKLKKGKTTDRIAEELEEEPEVIERICDVAEEFAPDYDVEQICSKILR